MDLYSESFCEKSDNELAVIAKTNKSAAAILVSRYTRLILIKARSLTRLGADTDDLTQEGLMALLSACTFFDPDRGANFSTFAETCIVNRMRSVSMKNIKNAAKTDEIDDPDMFDYLRENETPESIYFCKEYFAELMKNIHSVLSPTENKVFELYMSGFSYRSVSEKLGLPVKSVDNAMQRARRKLRLLLRQ